MTFVRMLAELPVRDPVTAERWYTALWGRGPDARPMPGLLEWYLDGTAGLQVWSEPARAGQSTVVIGTDDLAAVVDRLSAAGVDHEGARPGGGGQIVQIADPDGNRIVLLASSDSSSSVGTNREL